MDDILAALAALIIVVMLVYENRPGEPARESQPARAR